MSEEKRLNEVEAVLMVGRLSRHGERVREACKLASEKYGVEVSTLLDLFKDELEEDELLYENFRSSEGLVLYKDYNKGELFIVAIHDVNGPIKGNYSIIPFDVFKAIEEYVLEKAEKSGS